MNETTCIISNILGKSSLYVRYLIKETLHYLLSCSYNLIRFHRQYREKVYLPLRSIAQVVTDTLRVNMKNARL